MSPLVPLFLFLTLPTIANAAWPGMGCAIALAKKEWDADNIRFYERLDPGVFEARAVTCGMDGFADLMQPRLARLLGISDPVNFTPTAVAEIGGGFGRVVDFLVHKTEIPIIFVIERSMKYSTRLRRKYEVQNTMEGYRRVRVHPFNVMNVPGVERGAGKIDLVLWLWYGFAEIHPEDKPMALTHVFRALKPKGTLVIDQPVSAPISTVVTTLESQFAHFSMSTEPGSPVLHVHRFTRESLVKVATEIGFSWKGCDEYVVPSKPNPMTRALCFFEKPGIN